MPCHDGQQDAMEDAVTFYRQLKVRNDELARLLCEACGILQRHGLMNSINASKELKRHWKVHQEMDKLEGR